MMHPKNRHQGQYDLKAFISSNPDLGKYVFKNKFNTETIDFSDPKAVKALNKAILISWYKLSYWEIPEKFLCPPIPGRADYIHYVAEQLPKNKQRFKVLDIGTGANLIYPLIGHHEYGWSFVGSDINPEALKSAQEIIFQNHLEKAVEVRLQKDKSRIFEGVLNEDDFFDLSICNPPFHSSSEEAKDGTKRKWKNLGFGKAEVLNFSGSSDELWCEGGEIGFLQQMIKESELFKNRIHLFSSLISKEKSLPPLEKTLQKLKAHYKIVSYGHGNKKTRILVWTYT